MERRDVVVLKKKINSMDHWLPLRSEHLMLLAIFKEAKPC